MNAIVDLDVTITYFPDRVPDWLIILLSSGIRRIIPRGITRKIRLVPIEETDLESEGS